MAGDVKVREDEQMISVLESLASTLEALAAPRVTEIRRDKEGRAVGAISRLVQDDKGSE